jgi:hypothetical protein
MEWTVDRISDTQYAYRVDGMLMGYETSFPRAVARLEEIQRIEKGEQA